MSLAIKLFLSAGDFKLMNPLVLQLLDFYFTFCFSFLAWPGLASLEDGRNGYFLEVRVGFMSSSLCTRAIGFVRAEAALWKCKSSPLFCVEEGT